MAILPPDATANVNAGPFPLEQPTTGSSGAVPPIEPAIFSSRTHLPRISTKGWSIADLNSSKYASFQPVPRVSALAGATELSKAMAEHESRGTPLVIVDYDKHESWPREMFSLEWLLKTSGDQEINVRNIHDRSDHRMPLAKFVETSQSQSVHSVAGESQRLYWKDADCPLQWREWLLHHSPILPNILPGSPDDYLGYLSESETVESLLCYMGIGDTYTAAHKDLCCSSGHNLMCFSEDNSSSYWFMTAADDATAVAKYFHKHLKQELDWETHVTSLEELGRAPFTVYVVEQRVGDLILVPPRSCHQVVNSGGLAMKTSWSRMTLDSLETALHSELPIYRRVCRPEQYRVKTVIYRSILHLTQAVRDALTHSADSDEDELLPCPILPTDSSFPTGSTKHNVSHSSEDIAVRARKLKRLVQLFDEVLRDEYASRHADLGHVLRSEPSTGLRLVSTPVASSSSPQLASSSRATITFRPPREPDADCENPRAQDRTASCNFACDFCGADIFQSFFECNSCPREDGSVTVQRRPGDGILICPTCYVEGRNCDCADMVPMQCRPFDMLLSDRNEAARVVTSALPLGEALSATRKSYVDVLCTQGVLLTSVSRDIRSAKGVCVFEAACALRDHREQTAVSGRRYMY
ncbi:hypothetical protein C2E23DRAFT_726895 [Lenzites betulinus]|nr:hypothetical protein C2E23DRAFT_726895 [Lenzites betulinus]